VVTPGTRVSTFSTRLTQEAQVMPVMARSMVSMGSTAAFMAEDKGIAGSLINRAHTGWLMTIVDRDRIPP